MTLDSQLSDTSGANRSKKLLLDAVRKTRAVPSDAAELRLVRADGQRFSELEARWRQETASYGEPFEDFASPFIDHAREVAGRPQARERYGIYVLTNGRDDEGLAHLNAVDLPKTTGRTLKVLWILLAPKHDYGDTSPEVLARMSMAFMHEPLRLAAEPDGLLAAEHVKIHLSNLTDRSFFVSIAGILQGAPDLEDVAVRGNWLHLSLRQVMGASRDGIVRTA